MGSSERLSAISRARDPRVSASNMLLCNHERSNTRPLKPTLPKRVILSGMERRGWFYGGAECSRRISNIRQVFGS